MSQYMDQLCQALTTVLDRASQLDRRRLAGYAANIDFWIDEVQHRIRLIDGFVQRRQRMVSGTQAVYLDDISQAALASPLAAESLTQPNVSDVSADWDALEGQAALLREQVLKSASRFVRKCAQVDLITADQLFGIEDQLGVNLRGRRPPAA